MYFFHDFFALKKICNSLDNRFKLHVFHQLPDCQFPNKTNVKCNSKFVVNYLHERYHPFLNKLPLLRCIRHRCFKFNESEICNYLRICASCFYSILSFFSWHIFLELLTTVQRILSHTLL